MILHGCRTPSFFSGCGFGGWLTRHFPLCLQFLETAALVTSSKTACLLYHWPKMVIKTTLIIKQILYKCVWRCIDRFPSTNMNIWTMWLSILLLWIFSELCEYFGVNFNTILWYYFLFNYFYFKSFIKITQWHKKKNLK